MLGKINKVVVEYSQGWLAGFSGERGDTATMWRTDPQKAGVSLCHAATIGNPCGKSGEVIIITGLGNREVCTDISHFIPGNQLDDDADIIWCATKAQVKGVITCFPDFYRRGNMDSISGFSATKNGLYWNQENPNYLTLKAKEG